MEKFWKLVSKIDTKLYFLKYEDEENWELIHNDSAGTVILNSNDNTMEELKKWVKEHHKLDVNRAISSCFMILDMLMLIMICINISIIHSKILTGFYTGVVVTILLREIVSLIVIMHNDKILNGEIKEFIETHK